MLDFRKTTEGKIQNNHGDYGASILWRESSKWRFFMHPSLGNLVTGSRSKHFMWKIKFQGTNLWCIFIRKKCSFNESVQQSWTVSARRLIVWKCCRLHTGNASFRLFFRFFWEHTTHINKDIYKENNRKGWLLWNPKTVIHTDTGEGLTPYVINLLTWREWDQQQEKKRRGEGKTKSKEREGREVQILHLSQLY